MKSWSQSYDELLPVCEDEDATIVLEENAIMQWIDTNVQDDSLLVRCDDCIKVVCVREGAVVHVYAINASGVTLDW